MKDERIEGSEPAFACPDGHMEGFGRDKENPGLTFRQYAAIHLRVPNSGTAWLDDMITQRMRDDFAGQALAGLNLEEWIDRVLEDSTMDSVKAFGAIQRHVNGMADTLLAARETDGGVG